MYPSSSASNGVQQKPFPLDRFPGEFRETVESLCNITEVPIPAVASVVLGALSVACQERIKIRKKKDLISPVTLWMLVALESGERKTTLLNIVMQSLRKQEATLASHAERAKFEFEAKFELHRTKIRQVRTLMGEVTRNGESPDGLLKLYAQLKQEAPMMPAVRKLVHEDVSSAALIKSLSENSAATSIITDEFSFLATGKALSRVSLLCKAYDGSEIKVDRMNNASVRVAEPLVTMVLLGQNGIVDDFVKAKYKFLEESGFLSRFLYPVCTSNVGYRTSSHSKPHNPQAIEAFHRRITTILNSGEINSEGAKQKTLCFDTDAQQIWTTYNDRIETMMGEGRCYERFRPFAARLSDKAARIAAILHYAYGGGCGEIPLWFVDSAVDIAEWYAQAYVSIFGFYSLKVEEKNTLLLAKYLFRRLKETGFYVHNKGELTQRVHRSMRNAAMVHEALKILRTYKCVRESIGVDRKLYVTVDAYYLSKFLDDHPIESSLISP